jgi:hypothetical protein
MNSTHTTFASINKHKQYQRKITQTKQTKQTKQQENTSSGSFLKTLNTGANVIYKSVSSVFTDKNTVEMVGLLSKKNILHVGSVLQNVFHKQASDSPIHIPRIVVVGSQSSGKSSLLNGILSFDLLPTGKNMVTRTPLHLELIPSKQETIAEFGEYKGNGHWVSIKQIPFQMPVPTHNQRTQIRKQIEIQTNKLAGNECNISSEPIYLKIYAENIPNLTLVDLPGMTMVACTDRGQPADIKQKINSLISSYIEIPKTIILAVLPARTDIEADMAMELIKQHDPRGQRTIGILTKVDLMNTNTDICDYLENRVSKDLMLQHGYFAVRNRTTQETSHLTVLQGFQKEKDFFQNHTVYKNMKDTSRLGIPCMTEQISSILVNNIRECLPFVLTQINERLLHLEKEYQKIGDSLPETDEAKTAFVHNLLTNFIQMLFNTIHNRGSCYDTGRKIKEIFIQYRNNLDKVNPFRILETNRTLIENTIQNSTGNHMSSPAAPIEVLEQCLQNNDTRPMMKVSLPSVGCAKDVCEVILELIDQLLLSGTIARFPDLIKKIKTELNGGRIIKYLSDTRKAIQNQINCEENYIWTDNIAFHNLLHSVNENQAKNVDNASSNNINKMNELLKTYYNTYIEVLKNSVPKIIMHEFLFQLQRSCKTDFYEHILKEPIDALLLEDNNLHKKRTDILQEQEKLKSVKKMIQEL